MLDPRVDQAATYASWHSVSDRTSNTGDKSSKAKHAVPFRLMRELNDAYERFDLSPPHPTIRIVDAKHHVFTGRAIAIAAVTNRGEERIYFNQRHLNDGYPIASTVRHEVAHLATWRQYGLDIAPHGPEFKSVCRAATSWDDCTAQQTPMVGRR
ncbi:MAG: SprT-like domain-containing protein [Pseudomonadota bacterium]